MSNSYSNGSPRFRWTPSACKALERAYPKLPMPQLFKLFPGATAKAITQQALRLGVRKRNRLPFSPAELDLIRSNASGVSVDKWKHLIPYRSRDTLRRQANRMGLYVRAKMDDFEKAVILNSDLLPKEAAQITGRDRNTCAAWRCKHQVKTNPRRFKCLDREILSHVAEVIQARLTAGQPLIGAVHQAQAEVSRAREALRLKSRSKLEVPSTEPSKPTPTYRNGSKRYFGKRSVSAEKTSLP